MSDPQAEPKSKSASCDVWVSGVLDSRRDLAVWLATAAAVGLIWRMNHRAGRAILIGLCAGWSGVASR